MRDDDIEAIKTLQRELGLCANEKAAFRALLEQLNEAYDSMSDLEMARAMSAVRAALKATA